MISIEVSEEPDRDWNKRLLNSISGSVYQTKEYASYVKLALGWKPVFLKFVNEKGIIMGQLMLSIFSRFNKKRILGKVVKKIPGPKKMVYKWSYGPILFDPTAREQICAALYDYFVSKNCMLLGHEHPLTNSVLSCLKMPIQISDWGTFMIDLSYNPKILWQKLDKNSARKNIERSQRRGVYVKEMKKADLPDFHKLFQETRRKRGSDIDLLNLEIMWEKLRPVGFTGFLAYQNENPIGGIMVSSFNNYINEWGVARSDKDTNSKLYSQDLLKWKIIEWGISKKFRYYDLSGVNPNSQNEKDLGIFRYKKKWGGRLFKYNSIRL